MKAITFHFGVHRTGSTSIQAAMGNSRGILRSHGILYPKLFDENTHVSIPWKMKKGQISPERLLKELEKHDEDIIDQIVISAEDFCLMQDFSFLNVFAEKYQVNVVLYIKEQVSWLESWYNQHIKWPWDKKFSSSTPQHFIDNVGDFYWIKYSELIDKIVDELGGTERLTINIAGKSEVSDTVSDFFSHIGVDLRWLNKWSDKNSSLSSMRLELVRRIDLFDLNGLARNKVLNAVKSIDLPEDNGSKLAFNAEQCEALARHFESDNEDVARRYFSRDKLFFSENYSERKVSYLRDEGKICHYLASIIKQVSSS